MSAEPIRSFEEFWPYYVRAHANKTNRILHFAGTTAAVACVLGALVFRRPKLLIAAPIVGYGAAWIGHFFVEGNVPATFGHPLWSLKADFVMASKIVNGTMDAEVERVMAESQPREEAPPPAKGVADINVNVYAARSEVGAGDPDRYAVN